MTVFWPFFIGSGKDGWLKMVDFWAKWQAYSLTSWWKMTVFWPSLIGSGKDGKLKMVDFWQNGKPIALLFGGK